MSAEFVCRDVPVRVDERWIVRPVGRAGIIAHPKEFADLAAEVVPVSVYIEVHRAVSEWELFLQRMMARRVRRGEPEVSRFTWLDVAAVEYAWTDGVDDIETAFLQVRKDVVLELSFARTPHVPQPWATCARGLRDALSPFVDIRQIVDWVRAS